MSPLVSIIINNYNYGAYVRQSIESALSQSFHDFELLIVDDGSTDCSRKIIDEYADRARIILKQNGGQASAFNAGIRQARGKYFLFLDSDDYLLPEAVETCVNSFPNGYSRVYYRMKVVDGDGKPSMVEIGKEDHFREFDGNIVSMLSSGGGLFWPPTTANFFDASIVRAIGPIPEDEFRICADAYVAIKSLVRGPVRSLDVKLAAYRIHGGNNFSIRSRLFSDPRILRNRIDDHYRIPALLEASCLEVGLKYDAVRDDHSFHFISMLYAAYSHGIDSSHVAGLTHSTLLLRLPDYFRTSKEPIFTRVRRSMYLLFVLFLPREIAKALLRLKDAWNYGRP